MIAAVLEAFPENTQTFHHHRLSALREQGLLDSIWYARPADGTLPKTCEHLTEIARQIPRPGVSAMAQVATSKFGRECIRLPGNENGERDRLGALWFAAFGKQLAKQLVDHPDVDRIHCMFSTNAATIGAAAAESTGIAMSLEVHSPLSLHRNPRWLAAKLRRADKIIAISHYAADHVRRLIGDNAPVHVVRCGLPPAPEPSGVPFEFDKPDIVAVGSLIPKKGHEYAIRAAAQLGRKLTIIGKGPLEAELKGLAEQLDADVEFMGSLSPDHTREVISVANVGVLACIRAPNGDEDGIPVALMEYLDAGIPAVSTRVSGIPELLPETSLTDAGCVDSLADMIASATTAELDNDFRLTDSGRESFEIAIGLAHQP